MHVITSRLMTTFWQCPVLDLLTVVVLGGTDNWLDITHHLIHRLISVITGRMTTRLLWSPVLDLWTVVVFGGTDNRLDITHHLIHRLISVITGRMTTSNVIVTSNCAIKKLLTHPDDETPAESSPGSVDYRWSWQMLPCWFVACAAETAGWVGLLVQLVL